MTERRRIERFAELVDEANGGRRHHRRVDLDPDLTPLIEVTRRVGTLERPEPTAEFRDGLRTLLMNRIELEGIGTTAAAKAEEAARQAVLAGKTQAVRQVATPGSGRTRIAVLAGVAVGALALSGVSVASTDSIPGDALYSVKRTSEQAQLVLAGSDANRGHLHLEFARSRLVEATQVDPAVVADALAAMDAEVTAGARMLFTTAMQRGDTSAIDAVDAFVKQQRTELTRLRLDMHYADELLRRSLDLLGDVEARANLLRAALLGGACTVTNLDRLGPSPTC
jgi:Domain of unknown function (DUF5667)